jgi:hypothetical protein
MAISRFNPTILVAVFSLACITRESAPQAASAAVDEATIQKIQIEHVIPKRDFVGKTPTLFEWTAAPGADSYAISVENEIEIVMFDQDGITTTSVPWPPELKLGPGTYFWRIAGLKGDRVIADSGRAAFVIRE